MFKALLIDKHGDEQIVGIHQLSEDQLPDEDVIVAVDYSCINYKDGLAITGKGKIVRQFPIVPGIDLAGRVISSTHPCYKAGDEVVLTGWGVGESHWGGLAEKAALKADWLVPLPEGLSAKQAMVIGTAGLTAMLCVMALEAHGITPEQGTILVTGASGGVGSVAVTLLHSLGYEVAAVTGRPENAELLRQLGAKHIVPRSELSERGRVLDKQLWAGAIDTVGSTLLANVLSKIHYGGAVAACGLAGGADLPTTVMPFILRNVALLGVDSVMCPFAKRSAAWQRLAELLPASFYTDAATEIALDQAEEYAEKITLGQVTGRTLVKI